MADVDTSKLPKLVGAALPVSPAPTVVVPQLPAFAQQVPALAPMSALPPAPAATPLDAAVAGPAPAAAAAAPVVESPYDAALRAQGGAADAGFLPAVIHGIGRGLGSFLGATGVPEADAAAASPGPVDPFVGAAANHALMVGADLPHHTDAHPDAIPGHAEALTLATGRPVATTQTGEMGFATHTDQQLADANAHLTNHDLNQMVARAAQLKISPHDRLISELHGQIEGSYASSLDKANSAFQKIAKDGTDPKLTEKAQAAYEKIMVPAAVARRSGILQIIGTSNPYATMDAYSGVRR